MTRRSLLESSRDMWTQEIETWARAARGAGRAESTIRLRTYYLHLFADETDTEPFTVTPDDVSRWLADPYWKPETRKSARASLRVFYDWAIRTGRTQVDPTAATDSIRVPAGVPRPAPESVLAAALEHADSRMRLMLMLAAYGGLRRGEIARLHYGDIMDGRLRVTGKGGKVRWVPVHPRVSESIRAYLAEVGEVGYLFPGQEDGHLSPDRVGKLMSAALGPGWTAHTLRHRFGTLLYAGSHDLLQAQTLLGHSSPSTTQRYVAVPDEGMVRAVHSIM